VEQRSQHEAEQNSHQYMVFQPSALRAGARIFLFVQKLAPCTVMSSRVLVRLARTMYKPHHGVSSVNPRLASDQLGDVLHANSLKGKHMTDPQAPKDPPTQTEIPAEPADIPAADAPPVPHGMLLLELVPVPVSDIDRAKSFYADQLGFHVDVDVRPADGVRVVQLTPPGSACSITLTTGIPWLDMTAGTLRGLHLVVSDIERRAPG
jgi:hypothetical protein